MVEAEVSLRSLVSQCVELAQRAGTLIRGISDKASTEEGREALRLHDKGSATGNFDPQTVADRQAQRCIVENLRALYGTSLRVVGEEGNLGLEDSADGDPIEIREPSAALLHDVWLDSGDVVLPLSELCIWVDPLDGTKEFTEGRYEFVSTLIGISQLGQPVAGVIAEPYNLDPQGSAGRILWGCCADPGVAVHLYGDPTWKRPQRPDGRCLTLVSRSRSVGEVAEALERLQEPGTAGSWPSGPLVTGTLAAGGAGHKVARVVDGAADLWLFPRAGTSRWDTCAAEAMLEACGGALRDRSGARICYDPDTSMGNSEGVIAGADPDIVAAAVRVCATLDVARDGEGRPLLRPWLEQALGLAENSVHAFCVDEDCVRGLHAAVLRLQLCYSTEGAGPEALILKRSMPDSKHAALYARECAFFQTCGAMLREHGVQIPQVFYQDPGSEGSVVLMEDLIDKSFHKEPMLETEDVASALVGIAQLHGCSFENEALLRAVKAIPHEHDPTPSSQQAGDLWNKFLASVPGIRESDSLAVVQDFGAHLSASNIRELLPGTESGSCLVHGDFRSENIFLNSTGDAIFIDFKRASVGRPATDVACLLLSSAFLEDLSQAKLLELLDTYWNTFSAAMAAREIPSIPTSEQFRREFKLSCLNYALLAPPRSVHMEDAPRQLLLAQFLESLLRELHDLGDLSGSSESMPGFHAVVD